MSEDLESAEYIQDLAVKSIIGFDGKGQNLRVHPDGIHVVYPIGNKICIMNWNTKEQDFLCGHTNIVNAIDVSKSGKYVGSGQINHPGFKACVRLWDFETRTLLAEHNLHKVCVEAVAFTILDLYLVSLGGRDCGSVVVWDIVGRQPLCGTAASRGVQGEANVLCTTNRRGACFLTSGDGNLVVWKIDHDARNIKGVDVKLSKLKRITLCMDLNERDEVCYCGTSTGDVMKVRLNFHHDVEVLEPVKEPILVGCFSKISRKKLSPGTVELYEGGVKSLRVTLKGLLLIGAGDGTVELVEEKKADDKNKELSIQFKLLSVPALKVIRSTKVKGAVTSLQFTDEHQKTILAGTFNCEIFVIEKETFDTMLMVTCHTSAIYDIAFPHEFSEVFATAGKNDVRMWRVATMQELLRIRVQNFICSSLVFTRDGKSLLTAWNDGIIRSFTPLTGRLIFAILNAHNKGVSALAVTSHGKILISGGCEGQVRLWEITPHHQTLTYTLSEHKGPVSAIHINNTDEEAVSASTDGSCIIWDIVRLCRKQILFANTLFMSVRYFPTGVQILTAGSDRKLAYWEVLDGSLVRELEGSRSATVNSLDISPDGSLFVTGGNDEIVKLWKYQEGITTHIGLGNSAVITTVRFSPDGNSIVSASGSGSIFIWENPFKKTSGTKPETNEPQDSAHPEEPNIRPKENAEENVNDLSSARSNGSKSSKGSCQRQKDEVKKCRCCPCNNQQQNK